jgi:hypothetical protein
MLGASLKTALLVLLVLAGLGPARATLIASDNFDSYSAGTLTSSNNSGSGWASGWTAASGASLVETVAGAGPTGDGPMAGRALQFANNQNTAAVRLFSAGHNGNLWVDFLFQVHSGSVDTSDFMALWLDGTTAAGNSNRTNIPNIGLNANCGTGGACTADLFVRTGGSGGTTGVSTAISVGHTYRIVGLLEKTSNSTTYNRFSMWVDPTAADLRNFSTADAVSTGTTTLTNIGRVGFRTTGIDGGSSADRFYVDAIALTAQLPVTTNGPQAGQVSSIGTLGLALVGLAALVLKSRRTKKKAAPGAASLVGLETR